MSEWTRIYWLYREIPFEKSDFDHEIVWLFYAKYAEWGVKPGQMYRSKRALAEEEGEEREYYFDEKGDPAAPSHWQVMVTGAPRPEPPDIGYMFCPSGEPHDRESVRMRDDAGQVIAGFYYQCRRCGEITG